MVGHLAYHELARLRPAAELSELRVTYFGGVALEVGLKGGVVWGRIL